MTRTRLYREGRVVAQHFPVTELAERLAADGQAVAWLDLCRPTPDDARLLTEELGLDRLAVEDALNRRQRVKVERYDTHIFVSTYAARTDDEGRIMVSEISSFVTARALITVRQDDTFDVEELIRRWDANVELSVQGVAFLVYGLLDLTLDYNFAYIQRLDADIERISELVFEERRPLTLEALHGTFEARRDLARLNQALLPMREVTNEIMNPALHVVGPELLQHYQHLYDHVLRAIEWSQLLRDLCVTVLETHLTAVSNQQNTIMKKVTSWAAIIAVPTAITSFYGQNLPVPGRDEPVGFITSVVLSFGVAGVLYLVLRRKQWL